MASSSLAASTVTTPRTSRWIVTGADSPDSDNSPSSRGRLPRSSHHAATKTRNDRASSASARRLSHFDILPPFIVDPPSRWRLETLQSIRDGVQRGHALSDEARLHGEDVEALKHVDRPVTTVKCPYFIFPYREGWAALF